jgi:hypothetical protein
LYAKNPPTDGVVAVQMDREVVHWAGEERERERVTKEERERESDKI